MYRIIIMCLVANVSISLQAEKSISISGLPILSDLTPSYNLATDPLVGHLSCPALTRLNLRKKRHELVLLKNLQTNSSSWTITLKKGVKFWDGSKVTSNDLKTFIDQNLNPLLSEWLLTKEKVSFKTTVNDDQTVIVTFQKSPKFGPYVLGRIPLSEQ